MDGISSNHHQRVTTTTGSIGASFSLLIFLLATFLMVLNFVTLTNGSQQFNNQELIDKINNNPKSKWQATRYEKFETQEWKDFVKSLPSFDDSIPSKSNTLSKIGKRHAYNIENNDDIPLSFDSREKWPGCIVPAGNIMSCSAIGTFTIVESLSDRFCIASGGQFKKLLSSEYMLECDRDKQGCYGAMVSDVFNYLEANGTTTEECIPFSSGTGEVPACSTQCKDGSPLKRYRAKKGTSITLDIITDMQRDILNYGSIIAGFKMYFDLYNYKSGVYQHLENDMGSYFSTRIVGWGVAEDQTPYWICVNDFGTDWGNKGTFLFLRGADECGIESGAWSTQPDLSSI